MTTFLTIAVMLGCLMASLSAVEGIKCYSCSKCNDEFDSNGNSDKTATCPGTCLKVKDANGGVTRTCSADAASDTCATDGADTATCSCNTDLCNGSPVVRFPLRLSVLLVMSVVVMWKFIM